MRMIDLDAVQRVHAACEDRRLDLRSRCRRMSTDDLAKAMRGQAEQDRREFQTLAALDLDDLRALARALYWWLEPHEDAPGVEHAMTHLDEAGSYLELSQDVLRRAA